jgi:ABC-type glycerol-3-phosphate transport system substrate-binding protein
MMYQYSGVKGAIDTLDPQFAYSFVPAPFGATPTSTATFLHNSSGLAINAHSSPQSQAAAVEFINFVARPKQNALFTQITGGLTQYEFLKGQLPSFMTSFAPVFAQNRYMADPFAALGNGMVGLTEYQQGIGLITGQSTLDGALSALDAAWKQGTS